MFSGLELRFEIVEIIGSGGFGRVFRAIDRLTGLRFKGGWGSQ